MHQQIGSDRFAALQPTPISIWLFLSEICHACCHLSLKYTSTRRSAVGLNAGGFD